MSSPTRWSYVWRWITGAALATMLIWGLGAATVTDAVPWAYSDVAQRHVPLPGATVFQNKEGRGFTAFGPDGFQGLPDDYASKRLLPIMGDSYIEAFQVDMREKVFTRFNEIRRERADLYAVGLGRSDQNLSDVYFLLPRYLRAYPQIAGVVLLLHPSDVLPNGTNQRLIPSPEPRAEFSETLHVPEFPWLGPILLKTKLSIFYWPAKQFLVSLPSFRVRPGPAAGNTPAPPGFAPLSKTRLPYPDSIEAFWRSAIRQIRSRTNIPLLILMATHAARIHNGRVVYDRPTEEIETRFAEVCRKEHVPVILLYDRFSRHVRSGGALPRGFANSRPGRGHFNAVGHQLLAEAISDYLDAHPEFLSSPPTAGDGQ